MAQVMIIPISDASVSYANKVRSALRAARLHVDVDPSDRKMQKKVREAQLAQYNYILVRPALTIPFNLLSPSPLTA
jgi:threonyl-tRNA synthetase